MVVVLKHIVEWLLPATIAEIRSEVNKFYTDLGVKVAYTVRKLELPTQPLVEGETAKDCHLTLIATASIDEQKKVKVW